jgi:hypothetical protein
MTSRPFSVYGMWWRENIILEQRLGICGVGIAYVA